MEWNDIYDQNRNLTGRVHLRGTPWAEGEYGLVVCVWVYDGKGNLLLTRRAPEKSFAGTWENSGGAAKAGEDTLTAVQRELLEETGIRAEKEQFRFLRTTKDRCCFFDHYCLQWEGAVEDIVLLPSETDGVRWCSFAEVHDLIAKKQICAIIADQFLQEEPTLRSLSKSAPF